MRRILPLTAAVILVGACGSSGGDTRTAADTLTRAQKDSIIAELPIPGASAVGGALDARDRANERTQTHDTIR